MNPITLDSRSSGARDQLAELNTRLAETDWTPWLIIGFAAFLRFFLLGMKPPHFDEGINGWFVDQMVKTNFYRYDPTNYHGPLHFYVLFLSQTLFGRNLWALRLPVVLVSIATVWLTLRFDRFVGRSTSRFAALAMAISPGFVFYGRYSIHEAWLVFFSMLFLLGALGMWRFGTVKYLWCAGMGIAGMILTKETYTIHIGCAVIAAAVCYLSHWINPMPEAQSAEQKWDWFDLLMVVAVGAAVIVLLYSGTFFHWSGVKGLYQSYAAWFSTGKEGHGHEKPWYYWLKLILRYEWPVLIGLLLCLFAGWFKNATVRFLAIYGVGTLIAYSIVHYKTPWCIISIVWPFLFVCGAAASSEKLSRSVSYGALGAGAGIIFGVVASYIFQPGALRESLSLPGYLRAVFDLITLSSGGPLSTQIDDRFFITLCICAAVGGLAGVIVESQKASDGLSEQTMRTIRDVTVAVALLGSFALSISLNFFRCTTETEPYVYVQTYNDVFKLTRPVLELAKRDPVYYHMVGHIIRTSSYPLPWIFGDFSRVGYYEHKDLPGTMDADFLLVQPDRVEEVEAKLQHAYFTEPLTIRPYQETSKVYFDAKKFRDFFPGRAPDFAGKGPG